MGTENTSATLTIGMPVFNDVLFIEDSLKSLLNQTYTNFILILSDDDSSDGSAEICERYALMDERIKYVRQPDNIGISKNMEYLLKESQTKYFMWAADDDLWAPDFIKNLISGLENHPDAIVAFCNYQEIDEKGITQAGTRKFNYWDLNRLSRLKSFIRNTDDKFGYGILVTERINGVKFPLWWWPNKKSPTNNIFPSLCYYLSKGNYFHYEGKPLFLKRVKTVNKMNYPITGSGNAIKETVAYIIRRLNLVVFSLDQIRKAGTNKLMLQVFPTLCYHWLLKSSLEQIKLAGRSFLKKRVKLFFQPNLR